MRSAFAVSLALSMIVACPFRSTPVLMGESRNDAATLPPVREDQKPEGDLPFELKVDSTLVTMDVLVTDEDGRALNGLKAGNFRILDNRKPQKLVSFSPSSAPMTTVMLLEYSSASSSYFAFKGATWGTQFLQHLDTKDWVALSTFDLQSTVRVDFTRNRSEVRDALSSLGAGQFGESNLFDAIIGTLDKLDRVPGRKSIVLVATGRNSFSAATLEDVLRRLRKTTSTIFVVGLAEQEYIRQNTTGGGYLQAKSWLTSFAKQTGGIAFFPRFEGELPDVFRSIVGYLRNEYTLSFRPPKEMRDGKFHKLKVEIVGQDGNPLKVADEKGRPHKVEVYTREGYLAPEGGAR